VYSCNPCPALFKFPSCPIMLCPSKWPQPRRLVISACA
jgi:hypothetical protein